MDDLSAFCRINVVGTSGSGKSSLARKIADIKEVPYIEMDELFWLPDWTEPVESEFQQKLRDRLSRDNWVLDGNYSRTTPIKWERAQLVVWLDLPYPLIFYQVIKRTLRRSILGETLWAGNRESLTKAFFSRDSIILWSITSMRRVRKGYAAAMHDPRFAHLKFVRLTSRKAVSGFLASFQENFQH